MFDDRLSRRDEAGLFFISMYLVGPQARHSTRERYVVAVMEETMDGMSDAMEASFKELKAEGLQEGAWGDDVLCGADARPEPRLGARASRVGSPPRRRAPPSAPSLQ